MIKKYFKILTGLVLCFNILILSGCGENDKKKSEDAVEISEGMKISGARIEYTMEEDLSSNMFYECIVKDSNIIEVTNDFYYNPYENTEDINVFHVWEMNAINEGVTQICFFNGVTVDTSKLFTIEVTKDENGKLKSKILEDKSRPIQITPIDDTLIIEMEEFVFDGNILFNFISDEDILEITDDNLIYDDEGAMHHWEYKAKKSGYVSVYFAYGKTKDEARKNNRIAEYGFTVDDNLYINVN